MSQWTSYRDWEALPGSFRYKAVQFLDLNATDVELATTFVHLCTNRRFRVTESVVESFIDAAYEKWGMALGPDLT